MDNKKQGSHLHIGKGYRDGGRKWGGEWETKEELRYMYQLPMMNIIILYFKHVLLN